MSESRRTVRRPACPSSRQRQTTSTTQRQDLYVRARDLPRLLPLWPAELHTATLSEHARLLARLRRALRVERQRGLAGHWAYDLARHAQLLRAYRAEAETYLLRSGRLPEHHQGDGRG
jgi:hypothetical protein